jgi:hypothetical protein
VGKQKEEEFERLIICKSINAFTQGQEHDENCLFSSLNPLKSEQLDKRRIDKPAMIP